MHRRAKEGKGKQPCQISRVIFKGSPYEMVVRAYFKWANQAHFSFLSSEVARLFFCSVFPKHSLIFFYLFCLLLCLLPCSIQKTEQEWVIAGLPHPEPRPTAVHISQSETLILSGFCNSQTGALPHKSHPVFIPHQLVRPVLSFSYKDLYFSLSMVQSRLKCRCKTPALQALCLGHFSG